MTAPVEAEFALDPEREYEIVTGQPILKEAAGARAGGITARLGARLGHYIEANKMGAVYAANTTFTIGNDQRLPDLAFVSSERFPPEGEPEGIWEIAPDLAIEVISPNEIYGEVQNKMRDYFNAGVKQVWIVAPEHRIVTVYRSPVEPTVFSEDQELASEDLLPGFRCRLSEIFKSPKSKKSE